LPKLGNSTAHLLITGETGTGKERVAALVHDRSPRRMLPFVSVNCAAIPDALFESELFGYERGAFTGAHEAYLGKLRLAQGGTVLLDEVGEMSPVAQSKLLRVLESKEVFPLGARRPSTVDVRFIAATNQDLEPLVSKRQFRADLFYRLNVARVVLPPLRERKQDIPELFRFYVTEFSDKLGRTVPEPTPELFQLFASYDWPGNVRELRNLVEALFIDPPDRPIALDDLPASFRSIFSGFKTTSLSERDRLVSALYESNWNKSEAAAKLNWSRMTLYRKLSKYQIVGPLAETETELAGARS
jgi:transcriptional regulator with PAS, ATPase and Fis domain